MELSIKDLIRSGAERTDRALERLLPAPDTAPHSIHRAMRHSVFAGGKRLRPVLCFEAWRLVQNLHQPGGISLPEDEEAATDLGAAIEMLHTYSLIHDDLPALDNDDLRRGQPTCHKVFGEAIAILAGDALQTLAFHTIARLDCPAPTAVRILGEVAAAVGTGVGPIPSGSAHEPAPGLVPGMIGGQVVDIESEGQPPTAALVEQIHRAKTGALITVSIVAGGLLGLPGAIRTADRAGQLPGMISSRSAQASGDAHFQALNTQLSAARAGNGDIIQRLRLFGENAGLAFQIVDDVLDITEESQQLGKTAGKDTATTKATWPAVFGVEQSLADAHDLIANAFTALEPFGPAADPLKDLAQYLVDRKN